MRAKALAASVLAAASLAAPPAAQAHLRSGLVAVDYRAKASPLGPLRRALTLSIFKTDLGLKLTVRHGHAVTVIGYLGEPFIRVGAGRVLVNALSPTAAAAGLLRQAPKQRGAARGRRWIVRSRGRTVVWHTAGLRGLPPGLDRGAWHVPLIVDGRHAEISGVVWRVPPPRLWPWLLLGAPFAFAVLLVFVRAKDRLRSAALVLGALAGGAVIATAVSFALAANATEGRWVESGNELVFALVGLGVLVRGSPNARSFAAGGLGLLALAVGLSKLPVLLHGVVLSALPATPMRVAVATSVWAGAAATVTGLTVFFTVLDEPPAIPAPDERPRAWERALD